MEEIVSRQHQFFERGETQEIAFREEQLRKLKYILKENEQSFFDALDADFKKPAFETFGTELIVIYREIDHLLANLSRWAQAQKVSGSYLSFPSKSYVQPQPYGVSLVIGAWNYPIQLVINPALGSIAAGNCTILKPSEIAPHTADLLAGLINNAFDPGFLYAVQGDADVTQSLLAKPLDYIFFTGSARVGKKIMKAAAEQLTPLTLELGGKSPAIVDQSADISLAARRIAWGKFINAGQTCVSPDYVYIHESKKDEFTKLIRQQIQSFYGEYPQESPDYARIINQRNFKRLQDLMDADKITFGGDSDIDDFYIEPTLMTEVSWDDDIMKEEIFGPILPILTFKDLGEVISAVNQHPSPLALYIFTTNNTYEQRVINNIQFGGGCINDTAIHLGNLELPFGGIGQSGFGSYHGKASFDAFSQQKSIMKKANWLDIPLRYPPYENKFKWLKKLSEFL